MEQVKYYKSGFIYKKWRWTVKANNGEIIGASSQGFSSKQMAENNFRLLGEAMLVHETNENDVINGGTIDETNIEGFDEFITSNNGIEDLMIECQSMTMNCSVTYQAINDYSVEIYRGYVKNYEKLFHSDGHSDLKEAINSGLEFMRIRRKRFNLK